MTHTSDTSALAPDAATFPFTSLTHQSQLMLVSYALPGLGQESVNEQQNHQSKQFKHRDRLKNSTQSLNPTGPSAGWGEPRDRNHSNHFYHLAH